MDRLNILKKSHRSTVGLLSKLPNGIVHKQKVESLWLLFTLTTLKHGEKRVQFSTFA